MPFAATQKDLPSYWAKQIWQISYDINFMWHLINDTNEFIYKTEIDSQT